MAGLIPVRSLGSRLFPLVLLVLLAALSFWLERATQVDSGARRGSARHDPDYIVEQLHLRRFAPDGKLQHTLDAQFMRHYPDDDSTEVSQPRVLFQKERPAVLSSENAWMSRDGQEVRLSGNVRYLRQGARGDPDTVITTAELVVLPDEEKAHSDSAVTITQGNSVVVGTGVDADNARRVAVLRGRVQGTIYRKPPRS